MSASTPPSSSGTTSMRATCPWRRPDGERVVGDGLGVHAAADPGRAGAAGARGVAGRAGRRRPPWPPSRAGEAVRPWGRLGYPRRALRLHAAATAIVEPTTTARCPPSYDDLLALPGVGDYTAAAVASFAFGQRHVVLDTNVRRVLARAVGGRRVPAASVTRAERDLADRRCCPTTRPTAATWAVAVMELGALVCTAATPRCGDCPLADRCAVARRRPPGVRRPAPPRPDVRRHRPPVPRAGCWPCSATAPGRCTEPRLDAVWATPSSASAAWPAWSTTGCWCAGRGDDYAPALGRRRTTPEPPADRRRARVGAGRRSRSGRSARSIGSGVVSRRLGRSIGGRRSASGAGAPRPSRTAACPAARRPSGP